VILYFRAVNSTFIEGPQDFKLAEMSIALKP
jgi:hypothetical protein